MQSIYYFNMQMIYNINMQMTSSSAQSGRCSAMITIRSSLSTLILNTAIL